MKFKRLIAFNLTFIIILSSMGFCSIGFSQDLTSVKSTQSATATQLVADTQDPSHEFREGFKTNPSQQSSSFSCSYLHVASQSTFNIIRDAQFEAYLQKLLFQRPSAKLFLDFRSLII